MANKPDITNSQVVDDAVRLLKSDFVSLYEKQGFDKIYSAAAWHSARISTRGRELLDQLNGGRNHVNKAYSFLDVEQEAAARLSEQATVGVEEVPAKKPKTSKAPKGEKKAKVAKQPKPKGDSNRGERTRIAKELIASGETNKNILVEKAGIAPLYAAILLRNAKKAAKV